VWFSQKQLTELFGKAKGTISEHIKHIFEDGELDREATVRLFRTVQTEEETASENEFQPLITPTTPPPTALPMTPDLLWPIFRESLAFLRLHKLDPADLEQRTRDRHFSGFALRCRNRFIHPADAALHGDC